MEQFNQDLLQKFRDDKCTPEEYAQVLEWFSTAKGKEYLEASMSDDLEQGTDNIYDTTALYTRILDSTKTRRKKNYYKAAAVLTGIAFLGFGGWKLLSDTGNKTIHTAYGEMRTVVLPDNSVVTLNANSTLRYADREVWLEGEAYFSVQTDAQQPFMVHTASNINVEVLGTTFNLVDRHGHMQIVLTSGKVRLHNNNKEATIMQPGDLVEYKQQVQTVLKKHIDTVNYSSWKTNNLHFENASFAELSQLLEDTYGVTVEIRDTSLLHQQFTGTVPGQQIDILLEGLSQLFHLKVTNENNRVIIDKQ